MKQRLAIAVLGFVLLSACTGVKTLSTGLENEAFLEFIGNPKAYGGGVSVTVDDAPTFLADVNKDHTNRPKGKVYGISTGAHTITVTYNNHVLYSKQVFVASQESKKILLP
ncbi:MAG: hypothetical protein LBT73_00740 [Tannerellaceae bacterium]|jgi:hypothetical protein|nr:hypothetical protein [Tannerellaceae bacterium]